MTEVNQKRTCSNCGSEKRALYCESCKSETPSNIHVSVFETIKVRDNLRLRRKRNGVKRFLSEYLGGWFHSGDSKLPDGVEKSRTVDREKNEYHEVVKKYGTEEIIHETHEPLNKHQK